MTWQDRIVSKTSAILEVMDSARPYVVNAYGLGKLSPGLYTRMLKAAKDEDRRRDRRIRALKHAVVRVVAENPRSAKN